MEGDLDPVMGTAPVEPLNKIKWIAISVAVGLAAWAVGAAVMFLGFMNELAETLAIRMGSVITDPDHFGVLSSRSADQYAFYTGFAVLAGLVVCVVAALSIYRNPGKEARGGRSRSEQVARPPAGWTGYVTTSDIYDPGLRPELQRGGPLSAPPRPVQEPAIFATDSPPAATALSPIPKSASGTGVEPRNRRETPGART